MRVPDKQIREGGNSKQHWSLPLLKTYLGQKSFSFKRAELWNKLRREAKQRTAFPPLSKLLRESQ